MNALLPAHAYEVTVADKARTAVPWLAMPGFALYAFVIDPGLPEDPALALATDPSNWYQGEVPAECEHCYQPPEEHMVWVPAAESDPTNNFCPGSVVAVRVHDKTGEPDASYTFEFYPGFKFTGAEALIPVITDDSDFFEEV